MIKTCPQCNAEFVAHPKHKRFCSKLCCRRKWFAANPERRLEYNRDVREYRAARRQPLAVKSCAQCCADFMPRNKDNRFCSKRCGARKRFADDPERQLEYARKSRAAQRQPHPIRTCPKCNTAFVAYRKDKQFCSKR